jgi:hypothetical protein
MEANREATRMKLANLGRKSYVSQRGMQRLLQEVQKEGIPEAFSTRAQSRSRKALCSKMTPYGPIVDHIEVPKTKKTQPLVLTIQNPCAMLWTAVRDCRVFSELVNETCNNDEPKHIIWYTDGISPADGLKKHDKRKATAVYWSILDFGARALSHEEVWFCVTTVRNNDLAGIEGGLSHVCRIAAKDCVL